MLKKVAFISGRAVAATTAAFLFINALAIAAGRSSGGPQVSYVLPIVKRDSLLNGLQLVVLEQQETGSISMTLRIHSGAMFDLAGKGGLAHITAGMLLKGAGGLDSKSISETVESLSLNLNIYVDWDSTDIVVSGPANTLEAAFDLLGRLVTSPSFDQKELDGVKASRINGLNAEKLADADMVKRKAVEVMYGSHPFGRPPLGSPESIDLITRTDLLNYYNRFYLANNSVLIVTGDTTAETVTRAARSRLGAWKKGERVPANFRPPVALSERRIIILDRPAHEGAYAVIAQMGVSRRASDYFAAAVVCEMLKRRNAQAQASHSAMVQTHMDARYLPGPLLVEVSAPVTNISAAMEEVLRNMTELRTAKPSVEEVEPAKSSVNSLMAQRLANTEEAARFILDIELYGLGRDYLATFADRLADVTPGEIAAAAQTYLKPAVAVIVVAGSAAALEGPLAKFGTVTVLR